MCFVCVRLLRFWLGWEDRALLPRRAVELAVRVVPQLIEVRVTSRASRSFVCLLDLLVCHMRVPSVWPRTVPFFFFFFVCPFVFGFLLYTPGSSCVCVCVVFFFRLVFVISTVCTAAFALGKDQDKGVRI